LEGGVRKKVVESTDTPGAIGPYSHAIQVAALPLGADIEIKAIVQIRKS